MSYNNGTDRKVPGLFEDFSVKIPSAASTWSAICFIGWQRSVLSRCRRRYASASPSPSKVMLLCYWPDRVSQRPVRLYMLMSGTTQGPPSVHRPPGGCSLSCTCRRLGPLQLLPDLQ